MKSSFFPDDARIAICIQDIYTRGMPLEYDPVKAAANLKKDGVSFADAEGVLYDPLALCIEDLDAVGERRFVTIGLGSGGEVLVIVYTERDGAFRLISARHATKKERKFYAD